MLRRDSLIAARVSGFTPPPLISTPNSVLAWVKRMPPPDSEIPARSKMAVDRLIARREVHLREKTLWRMLDETVARAEGILGVNIEELDLAARRAPVKAKGSKPRTRRRGAPREDYVMEPVYGDAGTARLLPRLIKGRTRGPVFVTHREPGPSKVLAPRDVCPDTPGWSGCRTARPAPCSTPTPQSAGCRAQAGTCTNTAILVSPTSARPGPACPC